VSAPALGSPRRHLRATDSTNARAAALARGGAPHGTLVTADEQSAGRGRQGRTWTAPPGRALLMSLVLRRPARMLPLAAALAVADVVGDMADAAALSGPVEVAIKWPNDVWLCGLKCAGILVEGRPQEGWAVLGIGLNVALGAEDFPPELRDRAIGLGLSARDVPRVLDALLSTLGTRLGQGEDEVLADFRARDALRGRPVSWAGGSGVAVGVDADGCLVVRVDSGEEVALNAGEVHLTPG
jgi:BirA family biotin operon repressor/biotin-[acetyl-CoA-carboxylase] ligase